MQEALDNEILAIGTVLKALEPLEPAARQSVLAYVTNRLGMQNASLQTGPGKATTPLPVGDADALGHGNPPAQVHIRDFVAQKQPRSAIEMAVVAAYFLSHMVQEAERKRTITTKEIETQFKIAGFKLPSQPKFTLPNAKNAGYLDATGDGEYKLNPVGYNLVVHNMPHTSGNQRTRRATSRRTPKKPIRKGK
jgi:hypothetical protein